MGVFVAVGVDVGALVAVGVDVGARVGSIAVGDEQPATNANARISKT